MKTMNKYEKIKCNYNAIKSTINGGFEYQEEMALALLEGMSKEHLKLIDRTTPKKPSLFIDDEENEWLQCPICTWDTKDSEGIEHNYCPSCGQALDWSEFK